MKVMRVFRTAVTIVLSLAIAASTTFVVDFIVTEWYMSNLNMQNRSELSEDYGFAFLIFAWSVISFVLAFIISAFKISAKWSTYLANKVN